MNYIKVLIGLVVMVLLSAIAFYTFKTPSTAIINEKKRENSPQIIRLRFGHNTPVDSALHEASLRFSDIVKSKSKGRVIVEVFPSQKLGNDHKMVEMARDGTLDILLTPTAKMSVAIPAMQYADLPFYFKSREDLYEMLDGAPGKMVLDKLRTIGLVGVTFWENGFKQFTANEPLLSPKDFEGKKIRVMKSRIIMEQFRSFGAEPIPIDFHATKKALADGVVDGEENPLIAIYSMGFHTVQSHMLLSEHAYLGYVFSISEKVFKKLPQTVRTLLVETAKEVTPWEREETQKREAKLIERIKNAGVIVHKLTKAQREQFADRTKHISKQFEGLIGADIISKTEALMMEKYGPKPQLKEQIVIGIDTDLSMDSSVAGLAIKRGVELAVDEINRKGGVLGKPLAIIARDHRTLPSQGIHNIEALASREDVVAIVGGKHSAVVSAEMQTIEKAEIPYLVPWAAAEVLTDRNYPSNYIFRVSANDRFISGFLAQQTLKHAKNPAVLVENSAWGRGFLKNLGTSFTDKNGIQPEAILFNRGERDFEKEMHDIKDWGADSLILVSNPVEGSGILRALAKANLRLPIMAHWGIVGGDFYKENRSLIDSSHLEFIQSVSLSQPKRDRAIKLASAYVKKYHIRNASSIKAPNGVAHAYDLVHLLALAIKKAGTTDRNRVREALEHLPPYDGVVKYYKRAFTPQNHDALDISDFYLATFNKQGVIVDSYFEGKSH